MKFFFIVILFAFVTCEMPKDPLKAAMIDSINRFIDQMTKHLFTLNGVMQNRFDTTVASTWLYWRSASLSANTRGFVAASDNRIELCDCLGSLDDVISKVIFHLTNDVMKPLFDIRQSDTKIEEDLSKQLDGVKDLIIRSTNQTCLKDIYLNEYTIGLKYYKYNIFLTDNFARLLCATEADFNARFYLDHLTSLGYLIKIRSSIMLARTREDFGNFIHDYCKPQVFAKFENLIESSNNIINDCTKKVYNTLDEALSHLPVAVPFKDQLTLCL